MYRKPFALLLCFLLCAALAPITARADGGYTISAAPSGFDRYGATDEIDLLPGDAVTVTVSVNGGSFVAAACRLTYDTDRLDLQAVPDGWIEGGDRVLSYFDVHGGGADDAFYEDGMPIGAFTFLVKATAEEGTAGFALSKAYVAADWSEGHSGEPAESCGVSGASVNVLAAKTTEMEAGEYVAGYSLVLVYTNGAELYAYDGLAMYDVTAAGYLFENAYAYAHVYGFVVEGGADFALVTDGAASVDGVVDYSSGIDAGTVRNIYNTIGMDDMLAILSADVNGDKIVDTSDAAVIKNSI